MSLVRKKRACAAATSNRISNAASEILGLRKSGKRPVIRDIAARWQVCDRAVGARLRQARASISGVAASMQLQSIIPISIIMLHQANSIIPVITRLTTHTIILNISRSSSLQL